MKIWLNGHKVKETNHYITCNKCVFMRDATDHIHSRLCLAKTFNIQGRYSVCKLGYQYEDNV